MEQIVAKVKVHQKHRSASEWRVLVEEWRASGKTRDVWCREQGVGRESLRRWTKRLRATDVDPQLVELHRNSIGQRAPKAGHLRILASGDVELFGEISDELLRRVLRVVREAVHVS
jgi:hypothetical protein